MFPIKEQRFFPIYDSVDDNRPGMCVIITQETFNQVNA